MSPPSGLPLFSSSVAAMAGMEVVLVDLGEGALERAMHRIQSSLDRLAKKEQFTQVRNAARLDKEGTAHRSEGYCWLLAAGPC